MVSLGDTIKALFGYEDQLIAVYEARPLANLLGLTIQSRQTFTILNSFLKDD